MNEQQSNQAATYKEPQREPGTGPGPGRRKTVRKGMFAKDRMFFRVTNRSFAHCTDCIYTVKLLMYGFGDVPNPAADSISVMDDLVITYISEMVMILLCFAGAPVYRNELV